MDKKTYQIEPPTRFSESLIWKLNRNYYQTEGLDAWRKGTVPHFLSSNSRVSKAYAELIFSFLKDLSAKGQTKEMVYILELGAGHGRMGYHILKHFEPLEEQAGVILPPYCYILSDIVEENLTFFQEHPQFQAFFKQGVLEVAYFDAVASEELYLRISDTRILPQSLGQALVAIGNYFFDSLPIDLFHIQAGNISSCAISLHSQIDPEKLDEETLLKVLEMQYHLTPLTGPFYQKALWNELVEEYQHQLSKAYLFFPEKGMECIGKLRQLSRKGIMLLSMDKGFHELQDLEKGNVPEMITHGSLSFWVNYHAFAAYCKKEGGVAFFSEYSTFSLELACMLFLPESENYPETKAAFQRVVNDYGPDDYNSLKKFLYKHISELNLVELISTLRLGAYDSTLFVDILPRIKELCGRVTFNERRRLRQTLNQTWNFYLTLNEPIDLAFEIAGIFYELGFYQDALTYYHFSLDLFGDTSDSFYNRALCHYQLRQDVLFVQTVNAGKKAFPEFEKFKHLDTLDLNAE